jgi:hypothetical protein
MSEDVWFVAGAEAAVQAVVDRFGHIDALVDDAADLSAHAYREPSTSALVQDRELAGSRR